MGERLRDRERKRDLNFKNLNRQKFFFLNFPRAINVCSSPEAFDWNAKSSEWAHPLGWLETNVVCYRLISLAFTRTQSSIVCFRFLLQSIAIHPYVLLSIAILSFTFSIFCHWIDSFSILLFHYRYPFLSLPTFHYLSLPFTISLSILFDMSIREIHIV